MGFVNFLFYLDLVVVILAVIGLTVFVQLQYGNIMWTVLTVLGGLLTGIVLMLLAFLGLVFLYAFGELVQSSADTKRILSDMQLSAERFSPQNYREPLQVTSVSRNKATIAERKAPTPPMAPPVAPPVAPPAPPVEPELPKADPIAVTEAIPAAPKEEQPTRPSFSMAGAAGAPGFGVPERTPRPLFCNKCGARHEPGTASCRYCGSPLN